MVWVVWVLWVLWVLWCGVGGKGVVGAWGVSRFTPSHCLSVDQLALTPNGLQITGPLWPPTACTLIDFSDLRSNGFLRVSLKHV